MRRGIIAPVSVCARSPRRYTTSTTAPGVLQRWIDQVTAQPPSIHDDTLDPLRAAQLLRTLPTRQHLPPKRVRDLTDEGRVLGYGHHMVYFQPETMLRDLGADGSSPEYNGPWPYTRRMWAGGSITWSASASGSLRIGDRVVERRSIDKVEYKPDKDLLFIHQRRELVPTPSAEAAGERGRGRSAAQEAEPAVTEIRTHVFRQPGTPTVSSPTPTAPTASRRPPDLSFTYTPTSPLLFRYSALTFNAHKIHYDQPHTLSVERQPELLVHGPLTATLLIELAAGATASSGKDGAGDAGISAADTGRRLRSFRYRATSPIVIDREVPLLGWWNDSRTEIELEAVQEGRVGMRAIAVLA